tara:strand:+ start:106 stop:834 length:729 start_codon:yes stop_codon:yes gene_type:complete
MKNILSKERISKKGLYKNYLKKNDIYFKKPYNAPNVESFVFRFYGRILVHDFNITGRKKESILDFGSGRGGNLSLFHKLGFNIFGVDIAKKDINIAKKMFPSRKDNFKVINPKPNENIEFFKNKKFNVVISIQTLNFLSNTDMDKAIKSLYNNMKKGGVIYATLCADTHYYKKHAKYVKNGLWNVKFNNGRVKYDLMYNFTKNKSDVKKIFKIFKPLYIDSYDLQFRNEGSEKRFTFCGIKE